MIQGHHNSQTNAAVRHRYEKPAQEILEDIMCRKNYRSSVRDRIADIIAERVARETLRLRRENAKLKIRESHLKRMLSRESSD